MSPNGWKAIEFPSFKGIIIVKFFKHYIIAILPTLREITSDWESLLKYVVHNYTEWLWGETQSSNPIRFPKHVAKLMCQIHRSKASQKTKIESTGQERLMMHSWYIELPTKHPLERPHINYYLVICVIYLLSYITNHCGH